MCTIQYILVNMVPFVRLSSMLKHTGVGQFEVTVGPIFQQDNRVQITPSLPLPPL